MKKIKCCESSAWFSNWRCLCSELVAPLIQKNISVRNLISMPQVCRQSRRRRRYIFRRQNRRWEGQSLFQETEIRPSFRIYRKRFFRVEVSRIQRRKWGKPGTVFGKLLTKFSQNSYEILTFFLEKSNKSNYELITHALQNCFKSSINVSIFLS